MKQKIKFVDSRFDTQRGVQLNDGRIITLMDENEHLYLRYDCVLDLENGSFDPDVTAHWNDNEEEYKKTLNYLIQNKLAKEVQCYDKCDYNTDIYPNDFIKSSKINDDEYVHKKVEQKAKEIQMFFKANGYDVDRYGIEHNIYWWLADSKSGYRNEQKGYHLFSPCGCNPLSVRLTTLNDRCSDWQTTYNS